MRKATLLKTLAAQLSDALPEHIGTFKKDFEQTCRHILDKTFSNLDIVTREQFDTQSKVLARTRKKLEELDDHVAALEALAKALAKDKRSK